MMFTWGFTAVVMIEFLGRLTRQSKSPVFLIVDDHRVHWSQKVQAWLAQHLNQLPMFRPPADSPELNPDELLNQDTTSNALAGADNAHQQSRILAHDSPLSPHLLRMKIVLFTGLISQLRAIALSALRVTDNDLGWLRSSCLLSALNAHIG